MKLAHDAKLIALPETLTFINQQLFANEHHVDNLILDISRSEQITYEDTEDLLAIINLPSPADNLESQGNAKSKETD